MYIKDIYITFIKKYWKYYIFYFLSFISIPINQISVPHYYGKIIELLKGQNIEKASKFLGKLLVIWIVIQTLNYTQSLAELNVWPRFTAYSEGVVYDTIVDRYRGNFQELEVGKILTKMIKLPWILGSDGAGIIVEVGKDIFDFFVGDEVVVHPGYSCGECYHCINKQEYFCSQYGILGESCNGIHKSSPHSYSVVSSPYQSYKPQNGHLYSNNSNCSVFISLPSVFSSVKQIIIRTKWWRCNHLLTWQ